MFEFHGWARIESTSGRTEWRYDGLYYPDDDDLHLQLERELDTIDAISRQCVCLRKTVNCLVSLNVSGLRNHRDESIIRLFKWIAKHDKRSTGVLFTRDDEDDDRHYNSEKYFRVFRLCAGEFTEMHDLFEMPPYTPEL